MEFEVAEVVVDEHGEEAVSEANWALSAWAASPLARVKGFAVFMLPGGTGVRVRRDKGKGAACTEEAIARVMMVEKIMVAILKMRRLKLTRTC